MGSNRGEDVPLSSLVRAESFLRRLIWACFPEALQRGLAVRFAQEFVPRVEDGESLRACAVRLDAPMGSEPLRLGLDLERGEPRILLGDGIAVVACVTGMSGVARAAIYMGEGDAGIFAGDVDLEGGGARSEGVGSGDGMRRDAGTK